MDVHLQTDFLTNVNRMYNNLILEENEIQREEYVNRAITLKNAGIDITEASKNTTSYTKAFLFDIPMSVDNQEKWVGDFSKKYVELRDELAERFKDDEDEFYRQMGKLNIAIEGALKSTCLMPMYAYAPKYEIRVSYSEEERSQNEAALDAMSKRNKNMQDYIRNLYNNRVAQMDTFYERFINSIRTNDFDTAYLDSMR